MPTLIESELFGYVKGAFAAAVEAKLLRVLQEPVGSTERRQINVRIIAATNRGLETAIRSGTFRQDLYFRLNVVQVKLPPLRDRKSNIPILVTAFVEKFSDAQGPVRTISEGRYALADRLRLAGKRAGAGKGHRAGGCVGF